MVPALVLKTSQDGNGLGVRLLHLPPGTIAQTVEHPVEARGAEVRFLLVPLGP